MTTEIPALTLLYLPISKNLQLFATTKYIVSIVFLQLVSTKICIGATVEEFTGTVSFDITVGLNAKFVIKYDADVEVNITTPDGNQVTITKDISLKLVVVQIDGQVVRNNIY